MPRAAHIPLRDEEVVALGRAARLKYAGMSIEEVIEYEGIRLLMSDEKPKTVGGFSKVLFMPKELYFESLVHDDLEIESRWPRLLIRIPFITLVKQYERHGERVSFEQGFWHEYFHLGWSENLEPYDPRKHEWITHGVLDAQDEKRADLFSAAVLIDRIYPIDTPLSLSKRCNITRSLSERAIQLDQMKRLFSRDWTPVYASIE